MNMKIFKNIFYLAAFGALFVMSSCNEDDATGQATLKPTSSVSIAVEGAGTISPVLDDADFSHVVNLTLSEKQVVDVVVFVSQVGGDAVDGEDYKLSTNRIVFPAYSTKSSFEIKILADAKAEDVETLTLQIGDERTANASLAPVTVDFTINNYSGSDLNVGLSWAAEIIGADGSTISPTSLADLRLLVVDGMPYTNIIAELDGGSFESYTLPSDSVDGDYYIVADFYSAMDLGAQGSFDVDFTINNYSGSDLNVGLSWAAEIIGADGSTISPTSLADLRLLVVDGMPYTNIIAELDGGSFESYTLPSDSVDGDYYIVADFYSAMDLGAQGSFDVDLTVDFQQDGVNDGVSYSFPAALNTADVCAGNHFYLAKITKTGSDYVFTRIGEHNVPNLAGNYAVVTNGTNTDGQPEAIDHAYDVTVTDLGGGSYSISDGVAGVYILWYSIYGYTFETEGNFTVNNCDNTLTGKWNTGFTGDAVTLTGSLEADGTLSIHWENEFGDISDAVYTKK